MSRLLDIQQDLLETNAALARLEQVIAEAGEPSFAMSLTGMGLRKRKRELEEEFALLAKKTGRDVCRYRVFKSDETSNPSAMAATTAVSDFQKVVSVVFEAMKSGQPRTTSRLSAESERESTFDFGYTFAGSVGFVLTMDNERLLFNASKLNATIAEIFSVISNRSTDDLKAAVKKLGASPIRLIYKWANDHVANGIGADIDWQPIEDERPEGQRLFIQQQELAELVEAIRETAENIEENAIVIGTLVGHDVDEKTIHLQFGNETPDIRAKYDDDFDTKVVPDPKTKTVCEATLRIKTKIYLSTEREEHKYTIQNIKPLTHHGRKKK